MANLGRFDATQIAPARSFDLLPPGKYKVQIVDSDVRATKAGNGSYIWLELEILEGEHQGRKLWPMLTLSNPDKKAEEIGQGQISALCHACGKLQVSDTEELHFIPFIAVVRVRPEKKDEKTGEVYSAKNQVSGYLPVNDAASRPAAPTPQRPAAAAPTGTQPWKQKRAG